MAACGHVDSARLYAQLLAARPAEPFLQLEVVPTQVEAVAVGRDSIAWTARHPHRGTRWITGLGDGPQLLELAAGLAYDTRELDHHQPNRASGTKPSCPDGRSDGTLRTKAALLAEGWTLPRGIGWPGDLRADAGNWDWWWTDREPQARRGEVAVHRLATDDPRLVPFLEMASPTASARPGNPRIRWWAGIEEHGELLSITAVTMHVPGVPHLADVATHPDHRGRGLARDVCAWITRECLAEFGSPVTLGMYAHNDAARAVYASLGYTCSHRFTSAAVA